MAVLYAAFVGLLSQGDPMSDRAYQADEKRTPETRLLIDRITPLIITYNEAPNIGRTLEKLRWAKRIVLVDSGSTDGTLEIAVRFPQVEIVRRDFDDFASQCNFGLSQIATEWVLSLDADYELSDALVGEIQAIGDAGGINGFRIPFVYRIYGRPLRGTLYPPRIVLYRVRGALYRNEGHGHRVSVPGRIEKLRAPIYHDDRKPVSRWLSSQRDYARAEAVYLLSNAVPLMSRADRLRRMGWPAPLLMPFYVLFMRGCLFDGLPGWHYALQRTVAEAMIALEVVDRRLRGQKAEGSRDK